MHTTISLLHAMKPSH